MSLRFLTGFTLLAVILSGCFIQNIRAEERLRESVYGLNEEARWGRVDLAMERVAPAYQARFAQRRALWGGRIQIADADMTHLLLGDGKDTATSMVAVSWYDQSTMTVHQTVLKQHWQRSSVHYVLTNEEVTHGDASLIEPPAEAETEAGGDSESAPGKGTGGEPASP